MEEDTSEDEVVLDGEDTVDRPEVIKAVEMLQESSKQQLAAYNHLVEAISSMTDTEVRKVTKTVPKPDIRVPHSVLEIFDKNGDVNFRHLLADGQHLF